jgi:chromosome segregation ATPase
MQDESYVKYYIETLTGTMTDCVVRNVSLQATVKLKDDIIKQQADKIGEFAQANEELFNEVEELKKKSTNTESTKVQSLNVELANKGNEMSQLVVNHQAQMKKLSEDSQAAIRKLQDDIRVLGVMKTDYEKIKSQATHVDTFRTQLVKERDEHQKTRDNYESIIKEKVDTYEAQIAELSSRIDDLQTPATTVKKKKVKKTNDVPTNIESFVTNEEIKDGGEF